MKLSASLSGEDVEFLDEYAKAHACSSRSAVVHQGIRALRLGELQEALQRRVVGVGGKRRSVGLGGDLGGWRLMRRGEVRMVNLDPVRGSEANKPRPAIVVSNDSVARLGRGALTVVPVTSSVDRVYPFQIMLPAGTGGLTRDSKAQAEQVRSIDAGRVGEALGQVPDRLMSALDKALRLHLAL